MRFLLSLLAFTAPALFAQSVEAWKAKDISFTSDLAVLKAQGEEDAAKSRSDAAQAEYARLQLLQAQNAIEPARVNQGERDSVVALANYEKAKAEKAIAQIQKDLSTPESYSQLFQARINLAKSDVRAAEAELKLETFKLESMNRLVQLNALDALILQEEQARLDARHAELKNARKILKLAQDASN